MSVGYDLFLGVRNESARDGMSRFWIGHESTLEAAEATFASPWHLLPPDHRAGQWLVALEASDESRPALLGEILTVPPRRVRMCTQRSMWSRLRNTHAEGHPYYWAMQAMVGAAVNHPDSWWEFASTARINMLYAYAVGAFHMGRASEWLRTELVRLPPSDRDDIRRLIADASELRAGDRRSLEIVLRADRLLVAQPLSPDELCERPALLADHNTFHAVEEFAMMMERIGSPEAETGFTNFLDCTGYFQVVETQREKARMLAEGSFTVEGEPLIGHRVQVEQAQRFNKIIRVVEVLWGVARLSEDLGASP